MCDDYINEEYDPTQEEWDEIEEAILKLEKEAEEEDKEELENFKLWLKENGMTWEEKHAPNVKRKKT